MAELKLPELGENVETAEIIRLLVSEGDEIKPEQNVMELESEKAAFPLPSPNAGKVAKIRVKEGDTVSVGQTLLEIEETKGAATPKEATPKKETPAEKKEAPAEKEVAAEEKEEEEKPENAPGAQEPPARREPPAAEKRDGKKEAEGREHEEAGKDGAAAKEPSKEAAKDEQRREGGKAPPVPAGPATRRLARELGVDLHEVAGSESGGRITREDVKAHVRQRLTALAEIEAAALPDFTRWGAVQRQRLRPSARTAAERLSLAWRVVPHVTQHESADITALERARRRYNRERQAHLTVTALVIRAVVAALKAYPQFNSSFDAATGELIVKEYYHIGVAVDTEHGLFVPVLRDADRKTTLQLAAELAELADKARNRTLAAQEMEGSSFTITNLGGLGGTGFTPIIHYPEVAILGMSKARWHASRRRLRLPLSLSYDHRVINGADGVRFITKVAELLSGTFELLAGS